MAQKKAKEDMSTTQKVSIGLGLTAAAVTAASTYFLYGSKKSAQNRKKVKGWVLKAKGEVLEALENTKEITEDEYKALVEAASGAYGTMKNASKGEVKEFQKEMQEHWAKLQKSNVVKKMGGKKATKPKAAAKAKPKAAAPKAKPAAKKAA